MQPENDLRDRRVIVIGGSSGIGLAENAASRGAKIVIASSDERRLRKAVECIGGEATGERLDVSDEGSVETFFEKLGPIDHFYIRLAIASNCATWRLRISVKQTAPLNCAIGPCSLP